MCTKCWKKKKNKPELQIEKIKRKETVCWEVVLKHFFFFTILKHYLLGKGITENIFGMIAILKAVELFLFYLYIAFFTTEIDFSKTKLEELF